MIPVPVPAAEGWPEHASPDAQGPLADGLVVDVEGYEGPLDMLLALAREQKVDLLEISIEQLADQYLAYLALARRARLAVAAEYLVMAAWLAFLKSRLLLPEPRDQGEPSGAEMAAALAHRLQRLEAIRRSGQRLVARGQLGREFFARGSPEALFPAGRKPSAIGQGDLLQAYVRHLKRTRAVQPLKVEATDLVSVDEALAWIRRLLGQAPDWESLISYLPPGTMERLRQGELRARSALASTFVACLELAKQGSIALKQTRPFGPIYVKARATGSQRRN